ncbi:MAG: hypothetical protein J5502_11010 [Prevotella sp.]|nr:hypothetical protein [Prevotella sp.]
MKTIKYLTMAALALMMTTSCSNDDNELTTQEPAQTNGITITAQLAPKNALTRAVVDNGDNKITVTWAEDEHLAILYGSNKKADARITDVTAGVATIEFTVDGGTADNTPCTIVYPYDAAKDDNSGVKDDVTLLGAQDGTLNANLDVRVGAGTIHTSPASLTVNTQPTAKYAIFKFTLTKSDESDLNATSLAILAGGTPCMVIPASATNVLYAALPAVSSQTVSFVAYSGSDNKTYAWSKASVSFDEGYYYQSALQLSEQALQGSGTSVDPYQIYSKADWNSFAAIVNGGTSDVHAKQMAPINGITTVVGSESNPFAGTYDGQGYAINNVAITGGSSNRGLFGYVDGVSAVIQNVVVASGTVSSSSYNIGGIVGQLYAGTVQYCANYANVRTTYTYGYAECGGIVGKMHSSGGTMVIDHCINFGNVEARKHVAGIAGNFGKGTITYCQNYGTISATLTSNDEGLRCGGICGYSASTLTNNHNGGNISRAYSYSNPYTIIKGSASNVDASNTYLSSITVTCGSNTFTGDDLKNYKRGATAVDTNPTGIIIGGHYYAGPGAPEP